ncbi:MFS transporter, partial [Bradyrhizobium sp. Pear77]|nr:MFS transporter [Bradyrhizobium altum]
RVPLPSILPWSVVAIAGAATVVSFAVIADHFPPQLAGRANGALNVLHFGWAFLAQYVTGLILEQWYANDGHRPVQAYQVAFGLNVALQIATLVWFALPWRRSIASWMSSILLFRPADVSCAVESVGLYEDSVILLPADDDAEW